MRGGDTATGATHAYFGHDDWAPHAPGLKTLDDALEIRRRAEEMLVPDKVAGELAVLTRPYAAGFERPYGWAWAAMLAAAAARSTRPEATAWTAALEPLADGASALEIDAVFPWAGTRPDLAIHLQPLLATNLSANFSACRAGF